MDRIFKVISILFIYLFISNCSPLPEEICDTNTSDFQQLYNTTLLSNNDYRDFSKMMDTEIHAYSFTVASQKEICSVGYQSIPEMFAVPYKIVIIDSVNNITLFSKSSTFSSTNTSYINPIIPVILTPGVVYTISRIQQNHNNITYTVGRLISASSNNVLPFPVVYNDLTIVRTDFKDVGQPSNVNSAPFLPYIDIVFKKL